MENGHIKKCVIIGAGPAGLTAAYELLKAGGCEVALLEESAAIGGISQTVNAGGNRMDIGGHRFFSKDKRVTDWWAALMRPQGKPSKDDILLNRARVFAADGADPEKDDLVMLTRERVSRIYYKRLFFDYPVTLNWNTIKNMGFLTTIRAGFSYLATIFHKREEDNLGNFYINRFGKVLYSMFFEGYTEKLWGRHPRQIAADWGAQRVKGLSVKAVLADMFGKLFKLKNRKIETSLIERFAYPKYGPGQLWMTAADKIEKMGGAIHLNKNVVGIERGEGGEITAVVCENGERFICDYCVSSMPVKDLVAAIKSRGFVPDDISRIAANLPYRDFQTVGVLLKQEKLLLRNRSKTPTVGDITPDCWIYIQDSDVSMGRIQIFNNWSPYMVDDYINTVWIGLEYFCNEGDETWNMPDAAYIKRAEEELVAIGVINDANDIIFAHRERVRKAYPAYFDSYADFGALRDWLDKTTNLFCVGRNGQHRYNNMDHSMLTAFATVECIINGKTDKSSVWNVNTEGEYHETQNANVSR